jgi:hypothetical protein
VCIPCTTDPILTFYLLSSGLIKTHFFHIWVQCQILRPNYELNILHDLLKNVSTLRSDYEVSNSLQFDLPSHIGRPPRLIGEPSGGSLSADQWLTLAIAVGPVVVCDQ